MTASARATPWSRLGSPGEDDAAACPVRTICIIGAGASGLVAAKHLRDAGYEVTVLERTDSLGGAFTHKAYDDSRLVSSKYLTSFSDLRPHETDPPHLSLASYVEYLERYADAEGLHGLITYKAHVDAVRRGRLTTTCRDVNASAPYVDPSRPGYVVRVTPADAYPVGALGTATTAYRNGKVHKRLFHPTHLEFDAVCICSGLHEVPYAPHIPNMEGFHGEVLHSAEYREKAIFDHKRVLVIGCGETGNGMQRGAHTHMEQRAHTHTQCASTLSVCTHSTLKCHSDTAAAPLCVCVLSRYGFRLSCGAGGEC